MEKLIIEFFIAFWVFFSFKNVNNLLYYRIYNLKIFFSA